jgi:hypothetical protein
MKRLWLAVGLGLMVGAVLPRGGGAQDTARARARGDTGVVKRDTTTLRIPTRPLPDSILRDSLAARAARDSARARERPPKPPRDTIQPPLARAPAPRPIEIAGAYVWDRAALFGSGALTLQDLLDRVPGITAMRAGWIASPMAAAYLGDVRGVRLFYDGLELDELDPRAGGVFDLSQVQLWTLDELRIERGASEVRVYMRSWRVDRTTASTRTDIGTGDQQTNQYRGFFGRRYGHGEAIQLAAQQYGTTPPVRGSPSSDQLSLLGRLGWANRSWKADAFLLRTSRHRGSLFSRDFSDTLAGIESRRLDAYVRGGYGDPESGPWAQLIVGALGYHLGPDTVAMVIQTTPGPIILPDTSFVPTDTGLFRAQYVAAAGFTRWGLRLEGIARYRVQGGHGLVTPSARVSYDARQLALTAFAEARGPDSVSRAEVIGRLTPLPFVSFVGAVGRTGERRSADTTFNTNFARVEAGIRLRQLWLSAGIVRRDSTILGAPRIFDTTLARRFESSATGTIASIRGTIYKALKADVVGIAWNDTSVFYRPKYQARSEVYIATNWLTRFPSGNFGILASVTHEYRSTTRFPRLVGGVETIDPRSGFRSVTALLEIRIVNAVASYQFRNLRGELYETVPGYLMPRQTQFYGVRWEFWN